MVKVDEFCDPVLSAVMQEVSEGEAPRAPPPKSFAWWQLRRKPAKASFDAVWQAERPRVMALAARLTGNPDDAEDVAQEVAVRALRSWDSFRGDANVRTWLYRITLNSISSRRSNRDVYPSTPPEVAAPREDQPEERLLRAEGSPAVRRALATLPEELHTPLVLQVYEEMKCREIADLLELPLGTVLSRLHTARKRLLTLLLEGNPNEDAL